MRLPGVLDEETEAEDEHEQRDQAREQDHERREHDPLPSASPGSLLRRLVLRRGRGGLDGRGAARAEACAARELRAAVRAGWHESWVRRRPETSFPPCPLRE